MKDAQKPNQISLNTLIGRLREYSPADKFTWKEGDIEIVQPGKGSPQ